MYRKLFTATLILCVAAIAIAFSSPCTQSSSITALVSEDAPRDAGSTDEACESFISCCLLPLVEHPDSFLHGPDVNGVLTVLADAAGSSFTGVSDKSTSKYQLLSNPSP